MLGWCSVYLKVFPARGPRWELRGLHPCALLSTRTSSPLAKAANEQTPYCCLHPAPFICLQPPVDTLIGPLDPGLWPVSLALCSWLTFISLLAWHIALFSASWCQMHLWSLDDLHTISASLSVTVLEKQLLISIRFWLLISSYLSGSSSPFSGLFSYFSCKSYTWFPWELFS